MPFITVNGKWLNYADTKPSDSPASSMMTTTTTTTTTTAIIFVHGLGSTQNYFFPILPYLDAYRCITFDNYGAGRSKFDPGVFAAHSVESIAADVLGILDHLKIATAVVVGYSMGGMLPTYLASLNEMGTERVVAAVCIGPVHPSDAVADVFKKRIPAVRDGEFFFWGSCCLFLSFLSFGFWGGEGRGGVCFLLFCFAPLAKQSGGVRLYIR
jgi:pimeloyl-ACP methyl ester carboxylesterase